MHFRTAYVGLRDLGDESAGRRLGDVIFVELDLVRARNETDFTFHRSRFIPRGKNVKRRKADARVSTYFSGVPGFLRKSGRSSVGRPPVSGGGLSKLEERGRCS